MKRISILASGAALTLLAPLLAQGCSSAEEDPDTTNQPNFGQGGTASVGSGQGGTTAPAPTASATGTTPVGQGGSPPATGQGGAAPATGQGGTAPAAVGGTGGAAAGQGGTGATLPPGNPALCVGTVSNNTACTVTCTDPCGVFNIGTRVCTCTANIAACVSCGFAVQDPLIEPPTAAFPACVNAAGMPAGDDVMEDLDQVAGFTCTENARCAPLGEEADRYCGCRANRWDCDAKPNNFTF